ncbi:DNA replication protein [Clarireedia jacksonii]
MSYYDIDAILTDAQKIPCTFELDVPALGYLDNNATSAMKKHTRVDLPLWLAELLAVSYSNTAGPFVSLDLPSCLSPRVLNALKADPKSVDLRSLAQNFYGLGARTLELFKEEEVCDVLMDSWRTRAGEISDHAGSGSMQANGRGAAGEGVEFLRGLDEAERGLFRAAHEGSKAVGKWMGEVKKG